MNLTCGSQFDEDEWIKGNCLLPQKGTFVEVGAEGGIQLSNTVRFEQIGWRGLLIEPNPNVIEELRRNRPLANIESCAIGTDASLDFFVDFRCRSLCVLGRSGYGTPIKVPVRRLDSVLDQHTITKIDLLSLDTEGTELDVWSTFDHNKYKPAVVIIEHETANLPNNEETIRKFFSELPYTVAHRTEGNLILVRKQEVYA